MLKTLILAAAAAGVAAGLFTAAIQHVTTTPLIVEAEKYESGEAAPHDHAVAVAAAHDHTPIAAVVEGTAAEPEWAPAGGVERTLYTSLATTIVGVGFGLALLGAMVLTRVKIHARTGLAFGVAGFACFALAPALGLPPEIPGSGAAELEARQLWWLVTAVATAIGLAGLLLSRTAAIKLGGVLLMAAPHIFGAPHTDEFVSTAPAELAGHFAASSLAVTAIFWAVLGFASGGFYERFARSE